MAQTALEGRVGRLEIALERLSGEVEETSRSVRQLSMEMRLFKDEMSDFKDEMNRRWGLGTLPVVYFTMTILLENPSPPTIIRQM